MDSGLRRLVALFACLSVSAVMVFAAGGPVRYAVLGAQSARRHQVHYTYAAPPLLVPPPPPPSPPAPPPPPRELSPPPALGRATAERTVDAKGAEDPGGKPRISESSPLIQAMIEAGFSRAQAIAALSAVGAKAQADVAKAIEWSLQQNKDKHMQEAQAEREVHAFEAMDFDGYALQWGDKHRTSTLEECGQRCKAWKPQPPANFACNVFVFCPTPKCYAPAALPPGSMTGQCWLKHQEDPNNPQVNMRGDYSAAYLKRHPGAPPRVQWSAGVVVRKGTKVDLSTWSSRANW